MHVRGILLGADQIILASPHETKKIMKKLAHIGRAHEIVQAQLGDTFSQINPKVLVIEHAELLTVSPQKLVAIFMKGGNLQTGYIGAAQFLAYSFAHLLHRILGVSDRENLVRSGLPST